MNTKNEKAEEKASVTLYANIVEQRERGEKYWHRVGAAFEHSDGEGFTFRIPPGVTLSGEIVFRRRKPQEAQAATGSDGDVPF